MYEATKCIFNILQGPHFKTSELETNSSQPTHEDNVSLICQLAIADEIF